MAEPLNYDPELLGMTGLDLFKPGEHNKYGKHFATIWISQYSWGTKWELVDHPRPNQPQRTTGQLTGRVRWRRHHSWHGVRNCWTMRLELFPLAKPFAILWSSDPRWCKPPIRPDPEVWHEGRGLPTQVAFSPMNKNVPIPLRFTWHKSPQSMDRY
jgi:hypothetical protein